LVELTLHAITAPTEELAEQCAELAQQLSATLSAAEVEKAQKLAVKLSAAPSARPDTSSDVADCMSHFADCRLRIALGGAGELAAAEAARTASPGAALAPEAEAEEQIKVPQRLATKGRGAAAAEIMALEAKLAELEATIAAEAEAAAPTHSLSGRSSAVLPPHQMSTATGPVRFTALVPPLAIGRRVI
jgi:hypothetical protein